VRVGVGGGLEFFEGIQGSVDSAAGGIEAPLELGEGARVAGSRLSEGVLFFVAVNIVVLVLVELGFGGAEAAEGPLAVDEVVDVESGFGGGGAVALEVLVDELFEVGGVFGREDEGFGVNAGFIGPSNLETHNRLKITQ
jgi:hypothetical protein